MKQCKTCKEVKDYSEFYKHPKSKDRYDYNCKVCKKKIFGERAKIWGRNQYHKLKEKDPLALRIKDWKDIGLIVTREQYIELYNKQDGKCFCCNKHEDELPKKLCLDHDHKTMKIRGLLCTACNNMIGNARDNIETLQRAIEYLKKS
jgi:hypothetical protein